MSKYIEVKKISPKREEQKENVKDPRTGKPLARSIVGYDVFIEGINISQIKSFREFFKTPFQKTNIVGDVTIVYLFGEDKTRNKDAEMLINENVSSFANRLGAIRIPEEDRD